MFMPYVLGLFAYQHQNPVSTQCNGMGSHQGECYSLIWQEVEKSRHTNEDQEALTFTKQAFALEGNKHYPAKVLTIS